MKILVADDSDMLRERIVGLLSGLDGIEVVGHAQAELEALQAISSYKPDALILDIQMILGRGIAVLTKIKQECPGMVLIIVTNFTAFPYRKRCLEVGADFFLDKSTEIGKLREIIQNLSDRLNWTGKDHPSGLNG